MSCVWKFLKKIDSNFATCNLCGKNYKTSGNTSNLGTHLKTTHLHAYQQFVGLKKIKNDHEAETKIVSVDQNVNENQKKSGTVELVCEEIVNLSETVNQPSVKDCIKSNMSYQVGGQKDNDVTHALVYMVCKDNLPFSCVEKEGLKNFFKTVVPKYKIPSRHKLTTLIEQRYFTTKALLQTYLKEIDNICFTSDIVTITNSTRSFLLLTGHYVNKSDASFDLERLCLTAQSLCKSYNAAYIVECWQLTLDDFGIEKSQVFSMTTDGGANMVAASNQFLNKKKHIPCMAHRLNLVVENALENVNDIIKKASKIVSYFKHSVSAMDDLKAEQGKREGQVKTLIQSVNTRWNSVYEMLERFLFLSDHISRVLSNRSLTKKDVPDMVPISELNTFKDLIDLLKPFKEATEEISGECYVTASLSIPMSHLMRQTICNITPLTEAGDSVKTALIFNIESKLIALENNILLAKATILDPRFTRMYFTSAVAASKAISELSSEIFMEHKTKGVTSSSILTLTENTEKNSETSICDQHAKILSQNFLSPEVPCSGSVPSELKQYLDQPNLQKKDNPLKYWVEAKLFTPIISQIAIKYLTPPASSVPSERLASTVNLAIPDNQSRLTGEHIKERVFLITTSEKHWVK